MAKASEAPHPPPFTEAEALLESPTRQIPLWLLTLKFQDATAKVCSLALSLSEFFSESLLLSNSLPLSLSAGFSLQIMLLHEKTRVDGLSYNHIYIRELSLLLPHMRFFVSCGIIKRPLIMMALVLADMSYRGYGICRNCESQAKNAAISWLKHGICMGHNALKAAIGSGFMARSQLSAETVGQGQTSTCSQPQTLSWTCVEFV